MDAHHGGQTASGLRTLNLVVRLYCLPKAPFRLVLIPIVFLALTLTPTLALALA